MGLTRKTVYNKWEKVRKVSKLILVINGTSTFGLAAASEVYNYLYNREKEKAIVSHYLPRDSINHEEKAHVYLDNSDLLLEMAGGSAIATGLIYAYRKWAQKERDNFLDQ